MSGQLELLQGLFGRWGGGGGGPLIDRVIYIYIIY